MAEDVLCSIPGCDKPRRARGWCATHYWRWGKHGDPLTIVKVSNGTAEQFFQNVVLNHNTDECLFWPFARDPKGYGRVKERSGSKKIVFAHRRVCSEVNGEPPGAGYHAAHTCGNGHLGCCSPKHLAWKTKKENEADKQNHGRLRRGENVPTSKLTADNVRKIIALSESTPRAVVAEQFGVSASLISLIMRGAIWQHIPR